MLYLVFVVIILILFMLFLVYILFNTKKDENVKKYLEKRNNEILLQKHLKNLNLKKIEVEKQKKITELNKKKLEEKNKNMNNYQREKMKALNNLNNHFSFEKINKPVNKTKTFTPSKRNIVEKENKISIDSVNTKKKEFLKNNTFNLDMDFYLSKRVKRKNFYWAEREVNTDINKRKF